MNIKIEVISILKPIFGNEFIKLIETQYEDNDSTEIIKLADKVLSDFFGEKKAHKKLEPLIKKYKVKI